METSEIMIVATIINIIIIVAINTVGGDTTINLLITLNKWAIDMAFPLNLNALPL